MLTHLQRQALDEEGYALIPDLFSAQEMSALSANISGYHERTERHLRENPPKQNDISRANEIVFTSHLAEQDPTIYEFCLHPKLVSIATSVIGSEIDLYWNQSVFKQPETPREFPWHQDDGYFQVTPSPYLTCWLALTDATLENGCISVMPRWHQKGLLPHTDTPLGRQCHSGAAPEQGIAVPAKQGSVIVFWSLTPHKSGPNLSHGPRNAFIIQYAQSGLRNAATRELLAGLLPVARNGARVQGPVATL